MTNLPTILDLTEQLIRRQSVTPDDAGCQPLLAELLRDAGFKIEAMRFGETDNIWARRGTDGPVLCFAGHTDVVPPGDLNAWDSDPFVPQIDGDNLYGRGAADMKGSLAAMVIAACRFVAKNPDHTGSLAFLITSDEEGKARDGTLKVMEALSAREEKIDWCVVGEPSSNKRLGDVVRIGRRGSLSGMLTVLGTQGHVAYPSLAENPITRFAPAMSELTKREWDQGNEAFPPTSFQIVELRAGVGAPNVIPGDLYVRFNFRYCTEWHYTDLQHMVAELLDGYGFRYELKWHLSGEPFLTSKRTLIDAVVTAVRSELDVDPELSTGGGTSDGRFIAPAGVQVVELGPINESIHKVNEVVSIKDLESLSGAYQQIMSNLLSNTSD